MESIFNIIPMPLLTIFIGFVVFFTVKLKSTNNTIKSDVDKILEREQKALFVKKQPIPEDLFIETNHNLPFDKIIINDTNKASLERLIGEIKSYDTKKFLKPNLEKSNIELKEEFGHNSLNEIISYEQNYARYIIHINSIAEILIASEQYDVAEIFLNEAKNIGSDVSKTYTLLIDIYIATSKQKLESFISDFKETFDKESFCYNKTLEYYDTIQI